MAGRGYKKESIKDTKFIKKWKFGGYVRRSFDDGDDVESDTISNQKLYIQNIVQNYDDIELYEYYSDDGYSGTNFNRPDFQRMIDDIKQEKINGIIVKDLSRLGRNHIEVGKYIEEFFPNLNVRIISINDNVDSYLNPSSMKTLLIPIKNLMNESYARDISLKVSSSYLMMAKAGKFVGGTTPYGYDKDPNDKHHLIINEQEAKNVRLIFNMASQGYGRIKICKYLNDNKILCRREIQHRNKYNIPLDDFEVLPIHFWGGTTISRMLSCDTYIGNLSQLKTKRVAFGLNKYYTKNEDEWIRFENTHEAIISKDLFNKVQNIIKLHTTEKTKSYNSSIYNGILKCADCKKSMIRQIDSRKKTTTINYYCMHYKYTSNNCSPHKISEKDLNDVVIKSIQFQIKLIIELEKSLKKYYFCNNTENVENEFKNNVKISELKISNLRSRKKEIYEEWKSNKITKEQFIVESNNLEENIIKINDDLELYSKTYKENYKKLKKEDSWIKHYKRNKNIKKITRKALLELVDTIYVHENGNIEIIYKYQNAYKSLLEYLEREGVINDEKMESSSLCKAFI